MLAAASMPGVASSGVSNGPSAEQRGRDRLRAGSAARTGRGRAGSRSSRSSTRATSSIPRTNPDGRARMPSSAQRPRRRSAFDELVVRRRGARLRFRADLAAAQASRAKRRALKCTSASPSSTNAEAARHEQRVEADRRVVVELDAAVDLEPGLVEPAQPGEVDGHQERGRCAGRARSATSPTGRTGRRAAPRPAGRTPGSAAASTRRARSWRPRRTRSCGTREEQRRAQVVPGRERARRISAALAPGSTWLQTAWKTRCRRARRRSAASTARNLPHTYSPGRSGVAWSSSPTLCSSSRDHRHPGRDGDEEA